MWMSDLKIEDACFQITVLWKNVYNLKKRNLSPGPSVGVDEEKKLFPRQV